MRFIAQHRVLCIFYFDEVIIMKHITKPLSIVLALLMLISVFAVAPITASAEVSGDYEYEILEDGTAEITKYSGKNTVLEIPSEFDGYTVTSIGISAFEDCTNLANVNIPNGVTSIGYRAFSRCTSLASVNIPNGVTSIGEDAFLTCVSLTSVTIPSSVTSLGYEAFSRCTSLASVTIENGVTRIGSYAFSGCESLRSITIPSSVTNIDNSAFSGCTSLSSVTIENGVTRIGDNAFEVCSNLRSITIPSSVTRVGDRAFYYCTRLTKVTIPSSVSSIGDDAFLCCTNLTDVYYTGSESDWDNIGIGNYNESLTNATIHYNAKYPAECDHATTKTVGAKSATYFAKGNTGIKICADCGTEIAKGRTTAVKKLKTPKVTVKPAKKAIKVTYKKVKDAKGFMVTYKLGKKTYNEKCTLSKKELKKATVTKTIKVKKSGNYKVTVKAFVTSGKKIAYSKPTSAKTVKVK